jgi:DNA-binding NarL/FixJ family response regulator
MIKEIKINSDDDIFVPRQTCNAVASDDLLSVISALDKSGGQYCVIMDVVECSSYAAYKHKLLQINTLLEQLTKRESEILELVIKGMHNKAISATLNISVETVKSHRKKIVSKVGIQKVHDVLNILYDIFVSKKLQREVIHPDLAADNFEVHS